MCRSRRQLAHLWSILADVLRFVVEFVIEVHEAALDRFHGFDFPLQRLANVVCLTTTDRPTDGPTSDELSAALAHKTPYGLTSRNVISSGKTMSTSTR